MAFACPAGGSSSAQLSRAHSSLVRTALNRAVCVVGTAMTGGEGAAGGGQAAAGEEKTLPTVLPSSRAPKEACVGLSVMRLCACSARSLPCHRARHRSNDNIEHMNMSLFLLSPPSASPPPLQLQLTLGSSCSTATPASSGRHGALATRWRWVPVIALGSPQP